MSAPTRYGDQAGPEYWRGSVPASTASAAAGVSSTIANVARVVFMECFARLLFDGKLRVLPGLPASGHVVDVEPFRLENARREARAVAAVTVHGDGLFLVELLASLLHFGQEDVDRAGNPSLFPFIRGANINDLILLGVLLQLVNGDLRDLHQRQRGVVPSLHAADQIAREL